MTDNSPQKQCFHHPPEIEAIMSEIFGVTDLQQIDLFRRLKTVSHLLSYLIGENRGDGSLSSARMRLLIRLIVDMHKGNEEGLLPSELSKFLGVSRNTVSSLLNGLEEQGLVERHLHPTDRRQVLIRITPDGRDLVHEKAPQFAAFVGSLFDSFTETERETLASLLDKLFGVLVDRAAAMGLSVPHAGPEPPVEHS